MSPFSSGVIVKTYTEDGHNGGIERVVHRESEEFYTNFFPDPPKYKVYRRPILGIRN